MTNSCQKHQPADMWGRHQERSKDNSNCTQIAEAMVIKYGTPGSDRRNNQKSTAICDVLPVQERVDIRRGKTLLCSGGAEEHLTMPPGLFLSVHLQIVKYVFKKRQRFHQNLWVTLELKRSVNGSLVYFLTFTSNVGVPLPSSISRLTLL